MPYIYTGEVEFGGRKSEVLPDGDYKFRVGEILQRPYQKQNGNWVCQLRLEIEPSGQWVFSSPWSGVDKNGKARDGIVEFLASINRLPARGAEPEWSALVGASGTVTLGSETASQGKRAGQMVNKVNYFHAPRQLVKPAQQPPAKVIEGEDDLDWGPRDIPF